MRWDWDFNEDCPSYESTLTAWGWIGRSHPATLEALDAALKDAFNSKTSSRQLYSDSPFLDKLKEVRVEPGSVVPINLKRPWWRRWF